MLILKNRIASLLILLATTISFSQTNMMDTSGWVAGSTDAPRLIRLGTPAENLLEFGTDPHGNSSVLWKAIPDVNNDGDGGWNSYYFSNISHTKTYRFSIWIKKTNSQDGRTYFGTKITDNSGVNNGLQLNGTANVNPYFSTADLPQLNQWYLLVGFVRNSGTTVTANIGGIYDTSGNKVRSLTDFKMSSATTRLYHRTYLYYDTNIADRQYFFEPTIYEVNGQEPTIAELINPNATPTDTASPSIPTGLASSNITATTATLSWSASSDNIGVTAYEVYKNNNLQATVTSRTNYAITGLSAATTYSYSVKAKDAAGNVSAQSSPLTLTTLSSGGTPATGGHWAKTGTIVSYAGGKVGIGTANPDYELTVKGKIHAEEVKIDLSVPAPDYVFKKEYKLLTLEEVQVFINKNGHLPNIPSAKVMETEGVELGAMEMKLLEKIEELTLYILQEKENHKKELMILEKRILKLENK